METASKFRHFCNEKWYEHIDEMRVWENTSPNYGSEQYFRRNKWLLKKMYQEQQQEEFARLNRQKIQKELKRGFKKVNL